MVNSVEHISEQLFQVISGSGHQIVLFTDEGKKTTDPTEARRFYAKDIQMMVNYVVDETTNEIVVNLSKDTDIKTVKEMLSSIRNLANRYIIEYTVKTFGKSIEPRDFAYMAKNKVQESTYTNAPAEMKVSYDYSDDFYMLELYVNGKLVGKDDGYPGMNGTLTAPIEELASKHGVDTEELVLVATDDNLEPDGRTGTLRNGKISWSVNEGFTASEKKRRHDNAQRKLATLSKERKAAKASGKAWKANDKKEQEYYRLKDVVDESVTESAYDAAMNEVERINELTPKQKAMKQGAITTDYDATGTGSGRYAAQTVKKAPTPSGIRKLAKANMTPSQQRALAMLGKTKKKGAEADEIDQAFRAGSDQADWTANRRRSKEADPSTQRLKKGYPWIPDAEKKYGDRSDKTRGPAGKLPGGNAGGKYEFTKGERVEFGGSFYKIIGRHKGDWVIQGRNGGVHHVSSTDLKAQNESVNEGFSGWTGSARKSVNQLESARIIVKHKRTVDEEKRGARTRQIESIFIENAEGERFKFPSTNITAAKAMARHVQEGGAPFDDFGQHIYGIMEELNQLKTFSRKNKRNDFFEDAQIGEEITAHIGNLRGSLKSMSTPRGYKAQMEGFTKENEDVSQERIDELKDATTMSYFDESIADSLPYVARVIETLRARQANESRIVEFARQVMNNTGGFALAEACDDDDPESPSARTYKDKISEVAAWAAYLAPKVQNEALSNSLAQLEENLASVGNKHVNMAMSAINVVKQQGTVAEAKDTGEEKIDVEESELSKIAESLAKYDVRKLFGV